MSAPSYRHHLKFAQGLIASLLLGLLVSDPALAGSPFCADLFATTRESRDLPLKRRSLEIDGRVVYYEHLEARHGKPTLFIFSGLFTPLSDFADFQASFLRQAQGEGLLIMAYSTQVESIISNRLRHGLPLDYGKPDLIDFVREATAVLNAEKVPSPLVVAGYSFGSAPAVRFAQFHRERVRDLVLVAPLISPGDHSFQVHFTKEVLESFVGWNLLYGRAWIESMRTGAAKTTAPSIVNEFLRHRSFPEIISKEEVIEGLAAQIRAAESFDLRTENSSLWPRTSFLFGEHEIPSRKLLLQSVIERIHQAASQAGATSRVGQIWEVPRAPHTIFASSPRASVDFVLRVLRESEAADGTAP